MTEGFIFDDQNEIMSNCCETNKQTVISAVTQKRVGEVSHPTPDTPLDGIKAVNVYFPQHGEIRFFPQN